MYCYAVLFQGLDQLRSCNNQPYLSARTSSICTNPRSTAECTAITNAGTRITLRTKSSEHCASSSGVTDYYEAKERRGVLNPFFSKQRIAFLEPPVQIDQIQELVDRTQYFFTSGQARDLHTAHAALTINSVGRERIWAD